MDDTPDPVHPTGLDLTGGCLCGSIRYEVRVDTPEGYLCHCRMCQLAFGNTRAAFVNVRKDQVAWTDGTPTWFASSKIALRGFCGRCGTPLTFEYLASDRMDLSVGSLDDPGALRPVSHFAVESRIAAWHVPDGLPEERLDQHARLVERWRDAYGNDVVPGVDATRKP
ncbi:MAG: GFA family protein [Caldimonas sp.]